MSLVDAHWAYLRKARRRRESSPMPLILLLLHVTSRRLSLPSATRTWVHPDTFVIISLTSLLVISHRAYLRQAWRRCEPNTMHMIPSLWHVVSRHSPGYSTPSAKKTWVLKKSLSIKIVHLTARHIIVATYRSYLRQTWNFAWTCPGRELRKSLFHYFLSETLQFFRPISTNLSRPNRRRKYLYKL